MKPEILFLAHRIPYPPNRGDKMRSWNILEYLGRYATVHLASFADDAEDAAHLPALREAMGGSLGEAHIEIIHPNKLRWLARAFAKRGPVTVAAMSSGALRQFVNRVLAERPVAGVYAFSVQTAQYVPPGLDAPFVMDFVDFDSVKYADYSRHGSPHRRFLYRWEAEKMFALEKATAARADVSLFVSDAEAALFRARLANPRADIRALSNGIDVDFFDPYGGVAPLHAPPDPLIVFTGQMNYRPNIEGVTAFAEQVLPRIRAVRPDATFAIVGRRPAPSVEAMAKKPGIIVTGEVPDVRPWLAAASVVAAPLQIARGIQNKVLEAMAMARPVVASPSAFEGIDAAPGHDLLVAESAADQAEAILALLADPARAAAMGKAARHRMIERYSWDAQLAPLTAMLGLDARREAA